MINQYTFNGAAKELDEQIRCWLYSEELRNIVESFGSSFPHLPSAKKQAEWLLSYSNRWDYRSFQKQAYDKITGEKARWQINSKDITEEQKNAVSNAIYPLGLIGISSPIEKEFDYIIALGGARFSCLYRPRYMHELISSHKVYAGAAVLLSGMRPVSDSERVATDTYAPYAATEYDLINAGTEKTFGLHADYREEIYHNENPNRAWALRTYDIPVGAVPIFSVSGPSSEPDKRRANSADTYRFFLEKFQVKPDQKLLLVTSQIYVPYQQIEALRTLGLPHGLYIETVGFPVEWSGQLQGMMEPANYLQEIRSTIQALNRYLISCEK